MTGFHGLPEFLFVSLYEFHRLRDLLGSDGAAELEIAVDGATNLLFKGLPGPRTCKRRNESGHQRRDLHGFPLLDQGSALGHIENGQDHLGAAAPGFHQGR